MIQRKSIALSCILLALSGCGVAKHDLQSSGGYAGHLMDKKLLDADGSKKRQLLRATILVALTARTAVGTLQDGDDTDAFLKRLKVVNRELNYLAGDIYGVTGKTHCTGIEPGPCDTRALLFESNLPQLEYKTARLLISALPQKQAAEFAGEVSTGNFWSASYKFIKLGVKGADGLHRGAAVFRSNTELLAATTVGPCTTLTVARKCVGLSDTDSLIRIAEGTTIPEAKITVDLLNVYFEIIRKR